MLHDRILLDGPSLCSVDHFALLFWKMDLATSYRSMVSCKEPCETLALTWYLEPTGRLERTYTQAAGELQRGN